MTAVPDDAEQREMSEKVRAIARRVILAAETDLRMQRAVAEQIAGSGPRIRIDRSYLSEPRRPPE